MTKSIQDKETKVVFGQIAQRGSGMVVVCLVEGRTVDHAVTILTEVGVIIDPEEEQVLVL